MESKDKPSIQDLQSSTQASLGSTIDKNITKAI